MKNILDSIVESLMGKENVVKWWYTPNIAFNMWTPYDMFKMDPDRVAQYLYEQQSTL